MFQAFTFIFVETAYGWFQAHAYRFNHDTSTFIVETTEQNWRAAGLDQLDTAGAIGFCERLFEPWLQGHRLLANMSHLRGSQWLNFPRVANESWVMGNVVLMGDAAHSAHFSIGSGTKLAMEDAIALSRTLSEQSEIRPALELYQQERSTEALRLQSAARNRMEWFENVARYAHLDPLQFSYTLLTGSQRIGHENLRVRDRRYVDRVEAWIAEGAGLPAQPVPPMLTPLRLRGLTLKNRVVVSPMAMYSCRDGVPDDFYLVHLGSRAVGGAGSTRGSSLSEPSGWRSWRLAHCLDAGARDC
jgi:anthraniloyl-CoA monooxygenase